ncbi:MAG: hypothetical protein PHU25_19625 [Deltaproteobacteria bacterium]|nr:hypothetical protein [Deltaproteobacteria bacterium]
MEMNKYRSATGRRRDKKLAGMPEEEQPICGGHEWNFLHCGDEYRSWVLFSSLFPLGPLPWDDAVSTAVRLLTASEFNPERHLRREGRMVWLVERALRQSVRSGTFDRPRRGYVRAIERDHRKYLKSDWGACLVFSLGTEPREEALAFRLAVKWAAENTGLEHKRLRKGDAIYKSLSAALDKAIEKGFVKKLRGGLIRKTARAIRDSLDPEELLRW